MNSPPTRNHHHHYHMDTRVNARCVYYCLFDEKCKYIRSSRKESAAQMKTTMEIINVCLKCVYVCMCVCVTLELTSTTNDFARKPHDAHGRDLFAARLEIVAKIDYIE